MRILCISPSHTYAAVRLKEEASKLNVDLEIIPAINLASQRVRVKDYDLLYVRFAFPDFPRVLKLAKEFNNLAKPVVDQEWINPELNASKLTAYSMLEKHGVPFPTTRRFSMVTQNYPRLIKWVYGFGGKHVWMVKNKHQLTGLLQKYPRKELFEQEYIEADYEYKVITLGYKSLPFIMRHTIHPKRKMADLENYRIMSKNELPGLTVLAEKAAFATSRELAKVDILEQSGKWYVLEVNRSPGLKIQEAISRQNLFKEFLIYLIQHKNI